MVQGKEHLAVNRDEPIEVFRYIYKFARGIGL